MATQLIEQIGKGDRYHQLRPSIGICLLKGILFPARAAYHHQFRLRTDQGLELTECLEINTLELPKNGRRSDNEAVVVDKIVVKDHEVYRLTILPEKTLRTDRRMYPGPIGVRWS